MTQTGPVAEMIEFVVEQDAGFPPEDIVSIHVLDDRVLLRGAALDEAAGAFSSARVELLWMTPEEKAVLGDTAIDATRGLGAVIVPLVLKLVQVDDDVTSRGDRQRIAVMVRGLLSAVAAERVFSDDFAASPQQMLAVSAMQLVHARLDDAELSSSTVAKQLAVSLRTLQAVFHQSHGSVAEWIRLLRLERTWIELQAAPPGAALDVSVLGARWGFRGRDHFTRAFERRYGVRPELARGHY